MRIPEIPPEFDNAHPPESLRRLPELMRVVQALTARQQYLHWDKIRHMPIPVGLSHKEVWFAMKLQREAALKKIPLWDKQRRDFQYSVPDFAAQQLHQIDMASGGLISLPEAITNPQTRDQHLIRSLMEEAITSSQLEGAVTTRQVAKEMLRSGRKPRDRSERMILNNFAAMQRILECGTEPLTRELVFEIHRLITEDTLDRADAAGRYRLDSEPVTVEDNHGEVFHYPPPAAELNERMKAMCAFANGETPARFVHPIIRGIILHFWLAYDHPFIDGNGRTARALFYWSMLRHRYWLFEFISISEVLLKTPAKYALSFLYTETDDNDLTYFIVYQTEVIKKAVDHLHGYLAGKARDLKGTEALLHATDLNHRQEALLSHALRHPQTRYTIQGHRVSQNIAYDTARNDLMGLHKLGFLNMKKKGKAFSFFASEDLARKIGDSSKPE